MAVSVDIVEETSRIYPESEAGEPWFSDGDPSGHPEAERV